jgi:hypothetical protein
MILVSGFAEAAAEEELLLDEPLLLPFPSKS